MTRRYYLSRVDLVPDGESGDMMTKLKASDYGQVLASNIKLNQDGTLAFPWALCVVEAKNHAALLADPDIMGFPVYALDAKVSAMHGPTKTAMVNALAARGINTAFIGSADGFREVIRTLGRMHNPAFDENSGSWAL